MRLQAEGLTRETLDHLYAQAFFHKTLKNYLTDGGRSEHGS